MNVFVLCTGRCGSVTFAHACGHIRHFTIGHESRCARLGDDRFAYPSHHIEVDNRLAWLLGRLDARFGDEARYVHLHRDPEATARSFSRRFGGIMAAYRGGGILAGIPNTVDHLDVARDFVHTVTMNIRQFLRDKSYVMNIRFEEAAGRFPEFCDWIGAEVDLDAALAEFAVTRNASVVAPGSS
jgi:hypothetical protein